LTIDITPEQYFDLQQAAPYGVKKALFGVLCDQIIEIHKNVGAEGIAAIIRKDIGIGFNKIREEKEGQ